MNKPKLHPGIKNPIYWNDGENPIPKSLRQEVLSRDNNTCQFCGHHAAKWMNLHHVNSTVTNTADNLITCCVACHAIFHIGRNMIIHPTLTIWECELSQIEIIQRTREGLRKGKTLNQILSELPIKEGEYEPDSRMWVDELTSIKTNDPIIYLDNKYKAVFTNLKRWQLEE